MERSDRPRPAAADPAAAKPEPPKPAADGDAARQDDAASPAGPVEVRIGDEPDAAEERAEFEALERETTQPVRRYNLPYSSPPHGAAPVEVAHAVDYEPATQPIGPEAPSHEEPKSWAHVLEEALTPPASGERATDATWQGEPSAPGEETQPPAQERTEPAQVNYFTVEPVPLSVLPPSERRAPMFPRAAPPPAEENPPVAERTAPAPPSTEPVSQEPIRSEPAAHGAFEPEPDPDPDPQPEPAPEPEPEPEPQSAPRSTPPAPPAPPAPPVPPMPPVRLQHDVSAAWAPPPALRREPGFRRQGPPIPRFTIDPAIAYVPPPPVSTPPEPEQRDWRDLVRRAANVAFLVFCGWLIAVLLLIAVYRFVNPPFSMLMVLQWVSGTPIQRQWVPLERISPNLVRAVIVAEDGRFCQHWGVDFVEAAKAIQRATDGYPRGASTITMQVAKNLFLLPTKSYLRKMLEIPLTFAIELAWPKWRILEVYLNIVEWGPGIFGAEAASQAHFGRSAMGLTTRQAAQLAVVLPNPIVRDAGSPGPRTAHRASVIQARAARTREASFCVERRR